MSRIETIRAGLIPRPARRAGWWGTRLSALLAVLIVCLIGAAPVASAPSFTDRTVPSRAVDPPAVSAQGVFSFDLATGVILYEKNSTERMQVGSTVKIATALVVMKYGNLEDEVPIIEWDEVDITQYSNMQLVAGDTLTVTTLLYGLLLPSGNDGANALARHVGSQISGSDDPATATTAFVQAMNDLAAELGLENTRFANPVGLDDDDSYSSAQDIAILFGELMKDPKLAAIVREPAYSFNSVGAQPRQYQSETTNQLLGQRGVIGGKTGTTSVAGGCVVLAREVNNGASTVITAVLGSDVTYDAEGKVSQDARWDDAAAILDDMDARFTWVVPGADGTFPGLAEEMAVWGVEFRDPLPVPVPSGASGGDAEMAYQLVLGPPVAAGEQCGTVRLLVGGSTVGAVPIYQGGAQAEMVPARAGLALSRTR